MSQPSYTQHGRSERKRSEPTRQRLMDALFDVLYEDGPSALTTGRIAQRAGIVQSGFYKHFSSIDECAAAKAAQLSLQITGSGLTGVEALHEADPTDEAALARALDELFDSCLEHRRLLVIVVRHRHDRSVIGESIRAAVDQTIDRYRRTLWSLALRLGMPNKHRDAIGRLAKMTVEIVLSSAYEFVTGRHPRKRAVTQSLSRMLIAASRAEILELLGDLAGEAGARLRAQREVSQPEPPDP